MRGGRNSVVEQVQLEPKAIAALSWVVGILRDHEVPYQIVGGLAAKIYGAPRPLVDIDLYAPLGRAKDALAAMAPHIIWGPAYYKDQSWDITFLKADYQGQRVEIGDSEGARFFDVAGRRWVDQGIDYTASCRRIVAGLEVDVMPLPDLLAYKRLLGRPVDQLDCEALAKVQG